MCTTSQSKLPVKKQSKEKRVEARTMLELNSGKIIMTWTKLQPNSLSEAYFTVANGLLGERGDAHELGVRSPSGSTYMNGFFATEPIIYGEHAYGYAKKQQLMLQLPSGKYYDLFINGEFINFSQLDMVKHEQVLNMHKGIVTRTLSFRHRHIIVTITIETFASVCNEQLLSYHYDISTDQECVIKWCSSLQEPLFVGENNEDPRVHALSNKLLVKEATDWTGKETMHTYRAKGSMSRLLIEEQVQTVNKWHYNVSEQAFLVTAQVNKHKNLTIWKTVQYIAECKAKKSIPASYEELREAQIKYFRNYWLKRRIKLEAEDPNYELAVQFSQYSLLTNVGKDGQTNISAKGLTGSGYGGHYFWDTEIYIIPYFLYTEPEIARQLLYYRYQILKQAKERAEELSYQGALYAWRTINGHEASAYYPAGTAQIHINADIAYALWQYYDCTLDDAFMEAYGYEILYETALFYIDYCDYIEGKGYCFNGVTGPDEYTAIVNNNAYTNIMIQKQFAFISEHGERMRALPFVSGDILQQIKAMTEKIYIPKTNNIIMQDDSFFAKAVWDFARRPKRPLLLHYHPLLIYKHQVLKQPDVLLAMYLQRGHYSLQELNDHYCLYEPLTTHDSSLSECIHGILACHLHNKEQAKYFFERTLYTDLQNIHGNTKDGLHMANMGGCLQFVWYGLSGLCINDGKVTASPQLLAGIKKLCYTLLYRGAYYDIKIEQGKATVEKREKND